MARLLIIESEQTLTSVMGGYLRQLGHDVAHVAESSDHMPLVDPGTVDLILLDLDYADRRGLSACRDIRARFDLPIIAFSESNTELDRVLALQAGSDDCVAASCSAHEVAARIEAVMRRVRPKEDENEVVECGRLVVNPQSHEAFLDGERVRLTLKEFSLLHALAGKPGSVLSRRGLMEEVWQDSWGQASRTLDTHINSLRSKLGAQDWIVTVRGVGYRLDPPRLPDEEAG